MNDATYLRAELDDMRFAVPSSELLEILADFIAVSVPDAPRGICGVVYDTDEILALHSLDPRRHDPARLVILCKKGTNRFAYAADRVDTMGELTEDERSGSSPVDDTGILLLSEGGCHA